RRLAAGSRDRRGRACRVGSDRVVLSSLAERNDVSLRSGDRDEYAGNEYRPDEQALEPHRAHRHPWDVVGDDGWHDDAVGGADDPRLCARGTARADGRKTFRGDRLVCCRLSSHLERVCGARNTRASGVGVDRTDHARAGRGNESVRCWDSCRSRPLSMEPAKTAMPLAMPEPVRLHSAPWRLQTRRSGSAYSGGDSWPLLHRLLWGLDGAAVRRGRDEPALDCGLGDLDPARKSLFLMGTYVTGVGLGPDRRGD